MKWKWILIGVVALGILFLVGSLTGANQKLFKMAVDQIKTDESKLVKDQEDNLKWYEAERQRLEDEKAQLQKQKVTLQAERTQLLAERDILKGKINELQARRDIIIVSDDPDRIITDLRKVGLDSIRRR